MALATDDARRLTQALVEDPDFLSWAIDYVDSFNVMTRRFVRREGEILFVDELDMPAARMIG